MLDPLAQQLLFLKQQGPLAVLQLSCLLLVSLPALHIRCQGLPFSIKPDNVIKQPTWVCYTNLNENYWCSHQLLDSSGYCC